MHSKINTKSRPFKKLLFDLLQKSNAMMDGFSTVVSKEIPDNANSSVKINIISIIIAVCFVNLIWNNTKLPYF